MERARGYGSPGKLARYACRWASVTLSQGVADDALLTKAVQSALSGGTTTATW